MKCFYHVLVLMSPQGPYTSPYCYLRPLYLPPNSGGGSILRNSLVCFKSVFLLFGNLHIEPYRTISSHVPSNFPIFSIQLYRIFVIPVYTRHSPCVALVDSVIAHHLGLCGLSSLRRGSSSESNWRCCSLGRRQKPNSLEMGDITRVDLAMFCSYLRMSEVEVSEKVARTPNQTCHTKACAWDASALRSGETSQYPLSMRPNASRRARVPRGLSLSETFDQNQQEESLLGASEDSASGEPQLYSHLVTLHMLPPPKKQTYNQ